VVSAILVDEARRLGRQIEQGLDRSGCGLTGAKLKDLTEQHQDGNYRRGLEIDRDGTVLTSERWRKNARPDSRDNAV